jgi:hypothetical protein
LQLDQFAIFILQFSICNLCGSRYEPSFQVRYEC